MTNDAERTERFRRARSFQVRRFARVQRQALKDAKVLLEEAHTEVRAQMNNTLTDFQAFQLPVIENNIDQALAEITAALNERLGERVDAMTRAGTGLVDRPLEAGGMRIAGVLPEIDLQQILDVRQAMTHLIKDVTAKAGRRVKSQIGFVVAGVRSPSEATTAVQGIIGSSRRRALTIVRTELGRVYSVSAQTRQEQAVEVLPGLKKQWRRSGKIHSRQNHDLTDGKVVEVKDAFTLANGVALMYPRDPGGPPREIINCGCVSLPFMDHWNMSARGRMAFTDDEIRLNPRKRDISTAFNP